AGSAVLHACGPEVDVLASPAARGGARGTAAPLFIRALGSAYRLSRRAAPIVDTFGHNPYPVTSSEPSWARHPAGDSLSEGDYGALMQAYYDAFAGTGQALPGVGATRIWYLEDGFQTAVDDAHRSA